MGMVIDSEADITKLYATHPKTAQRFEQLQIAVNSPSEQTIQSRPRIEVIQKRNQCIEEIRRLPGYERFLLAPSIVEMQQAASDGYIVVINSSNLRNDAIIVSKSTVDLVPLPNFLYPNVHLGSPKALEWLWDTVTSPILDALGFTQPPTGDDWPHIWWIPTGPLNRYPIHAAGRHTKGSSFTVLDRVMSSYSSSVKAIIHSRQRKIIRSTTPQALLVAMEHTPGNSSLPLSRYGYRIAPLTSNPVVI